MIYPIINLQVQRISVLFLAECLLQLSRERETRYWIFCPDVPFRSHEFLDF